MAGSRRDQAFTAIRIEGGILPADYLQAIARSEAPRQSGADYGLSPSLELKEELARYWRIAQDCHIRYASRHVRRDVSAQGAGVRDWLMPFLQDVLGYRDLAPTSSSYLTLGDRSYRVTHQACDHAVPFLLTTRDHDLDRAAAAFGVEGRKEIPHVLMQEYLNVEDDSLWGFVSDGKILRILRDNPSLTRPAYIEADLDLIFADDLYADFAALWLTAHATRFQPVDARPDKCVMEVWRTEAHETGERALDTLRYGVTEALTHLGGGFIRHKENQALRSAFLTGALTAEEYFQQLLRLVYRLLFLFTAEERELLHPPDATDAQRRLYQAGYSLGRLRDKAERQRHYDRHSDLWQGLQITLRGLQGGLPPLGLPGLGGLFEAAQCPDLDSSRIDNASLLQAIRRLTVFVSGKQTVRVNYRDMDAEELGSVYESLLELEPIVNVHASPCTFDLRGGETGKQLKGSKRKLSGSYYTPDILVQELVQSTLDPVITQTLAAHPTDPRSALLGLRVLDPACGSGHFLLAAARRLAYALARLDSESDSVDENMRQHALREVVQHCIYGVDRNPLAVELCRFALWREAVEPGKPLTFLESHIRHGDSLVGLQDPAVMEDGIPAEAFTPLTLDDKKTCSALKKLNRQAGKALQPGLFEKYELPSSTLSMANLADLPEDTVEDVEWKHQLLEQSRKEQEFVRRKQPWDLYAASFFAPRHEGTIDQVPYTADLIRLLDGDEKLPIRTQVLKNVEALAKEHSFFHWHLEFPDVMACGGFDVILSNPPWEKFTFQEEEFFSGRDESIASARNQSIRAKMIQQLNREESSLAEKALFDAFQQAKRRNETVALFVRKGKRFPLTGRGITNNYAVFAEACLGLLHPRGRAGLLVPTGIATDDTTKLFFNDLVDNQRIVSLFDFENREKLFKIDSRLKFSLLTLTGTEQPCRQAEFAFFLTHPDQLRHAERRVTLTAEDFALFNPNTRTCPIFRTQRDAEIARKIYRRAGVLWKEGQGDEPDINPWGVSFHTMFNMSVASGMFRTRTQLEEEGWTLEGNVFVRGGRYYLPLYEAKMFHQYDHRFSTFDGVSEKDIRAGNSRAMSTEEKSDPNSVALPRYWISAENVRDRLDKMGLDISHNRHDTTRHDTTRHDTTRHDTTRHDTTRHDTEQKLCIWLADRSQEYHKINRRTNSPSHYNAQGPVRRFKFSTPFGFVSFRDIVRSTDERTVIFTLLEEVALNNKAPYLALDSKKWIEVLRGLTTSTNERTVIGQVMPHVSVANSAPTMDYAEGPAFCALLVMANMNSIPLDWAARVSVGGTNLNFFIAKQLPVLPPETYLTPVPFSSSTYAELIAPRSFELIYTSHQLQTFAEDLGYEGPPFPWDEARRHILRCELDALYAHMYGLDRSALEWILDSEGHSASFPTLKRNEISTYGEYRTKRYVLQAYDQLSKGDSLSLNKA